MRELFLFIIVMLLITSMTGFVGCSRDDLRVMDVMPEDPLGELGEWTIEDLYIDVFDILISEDRPAQVMVTVFGSHFNTSISVHEVHHERKGNTIFISAKKRVHPLGGDAVTEVQEQVSIGEFAVGEYKLIVNDTTEHGFGIEDNGHWITAFLESSLDDDWIIEDMPIVDLKTSISESRPAQVKVMITGGSHSNTCVSVHKIHQTREGNTFNIQITWRRERPGGGLICGPLVIEEVPAEVFLGTLGVGAYKVSVNGIPREFHID